MRAIDVHGALSDRANGGRIDVSDPQVPLVLHRIRELFDELALCWRPRPPPIYFSIQDDVHRCYWRHRLEIVESELALSQSLLVLLNSVISLPVELVAEQSLKLKPRKVSLFREHALYHLRPHLLPRQLLSDQLGVFHKVCRHFLDCGVKDKLSDKLIDGGKDPIFDEGVLEDQLQKTSADIDLHVSHVHLDQFLAGCLVLYDYFSTTGLASTRRKSHQVMLHRLFLTRQILKPSHLCASERKSDAAIELFGPAVDHAEVIDVCPKKFPYIRRLFAGVVVCSHGDGRN